MKRNINKFLKTNRQYVVMASVVITLLTIIVWSFMVIAQKEALINQQSTTGNSESADIESILTEHNITPLATTQASNDSETTQNLLYLIEEEKLAKQQAEESQMDNGK